MKTFQKPYLLMCKQREDKRESELLDQGICIDITRPCVTMLMFRTYKLLIICLPVFYLHFIMLWEISYILKKKNFFFLSKSFFNSSLKMK